MKNTDADNLNQSAGRVLGLTQNERMGDGVCCAGAVDCKGAARSLRCARFRQIAWRFSLLGFGLASVLLVFRGALFACVRVARSVHSACVCVCVCACVRMRV